MIGLTIKTLICVKNRRPDNVSDDEYKPSDSNKDQQSFQMKTKLGKAKYKNPSKNLLKNPNQVL